MSYYFWINIAAISIPLIVSFDSRLKFHHKWKYLFPAMLATMLVFVPWDIIKTSMGVWGFNQQHLLGYWFFNLPVEELMFFIAIPFACVFTYHSLGYLIKKDHLKPFAKSISIVLITVLTILALINIDRTYTFVTFITTAAFLLIHLTFIKADYLGRFYISFLFILIPFLLVNGALTGMFTPEPVVWYDDSRNLGIRIFTIPIEDSVYALLLLLMNTTIYEALNRKRNSQKAGFNKPSTNSH